MHTLSLSLLLLATSPCADPAIVQEPPAKEAPAAPQATTPKPPRPFHMLAREMPDGLRMTADLYEAPAPADPKTPRVIVVGFHTGGGSRAEYRNIGPEFVALGCSLLAVDMRSGGTRFGVENETAKLFTQRNRKTPGTYAQAYSDVGFADSWAHELQPGAKVVLCGSSFSASLALVYAGREPAAVDMVLAFAPTECIQGWTVANDAKKVKVPVYITCGTGAGELGETKKIAGAIDPKLLTEFYPPEGMAAEHGVLTLAVRPAADHEQQWEPVKKMLAQLK